MAQKLQPGTQVFGNKGQLLTTTGPAPTTTPMASTAATVASTPIPAQNITTNIPTYAPPAPVVPNSAKVATAAVAGREPIETVAPVQSPKDQVTQSFLDKVLGRDIAGEKAQLREGADLMQKQEEANRLQNELKSSQKAYQDEIDALYENKDSVSAGAAQARISQLQRRANSDLANIAIQAEFANNNYVGAEKILNAQLDDLQQDYDNTIKTYQVAQDFLTNDLSKTEEIELQRQIEKEQADYQFERQKALSQFNAQLEQSSPLYKAQLARAKAELASSQGGGEMASPLRIAAAKGNIDLVDNLTTDTAIRSAVGPNILARFVGRGLDSATGARSNFVAGVEQLRSQLSLDSLISAKERGATFGALSEGELNILSSSASKLGTWAIKDKAGNVTGYRASEADFKKELDKINAFAKLDYLYRGGSLEDIGGKVTDDGKIWIRNSDGTFTSLN